LTEAVQNRRLAAAAMHDVAGDEFRSVADYVAMAGKIDRLRPCCEPMERGHVVAHGSIRWRHDRGRPAHHVVTRKQHFGALESESHVVCGVPRRRNRFKRPAVAGNYIAVGEAMVRNKVGVTASVESFGLADEQRSRRPMRTLAVGGGAGCGLDGRGAGGMIAMGVGDNDMRHRLAVYSLEQRRSVLLVDRSGIDDRDVAATDDIAERPLKRERSRIIGQDTPYAGRDMVDGTGGE